MDEKFCICLGRQLGSGGYQIGKKLAEELSVPFYDKELIEVASKESGLGKEFFEKADEKPKRGLTGGFFSLNSSFDEIYISDYLGHETLFKIQSDIIRELAQKNSSVFVGRCADYVLRENKRCLSVFICANRDDRIKRISGIQQLPENKAADFIRKMDKKRADYYNYYSNKTWGAAESYHLCVNSSILGIDGSVALIRRFAGQSLGL